MMVLSEAEWQPIETAPKDGTEVLLFMPGYGGRVKLGSFRVDDGFSGNENPLWLDDSYDDFSCGYASTPLDPTHWMALPLPPAIRALQEDGR
jgi:hypothetical protein